MFQFYTDWHMSSLMACYMHLSNLTFTSRCSLTCSTTTTRRCSLTCSTTTTCGYGRPTSPPAEIKRSRDRVRYANMSDEAKKEKISRRIWTVPLSEGMSLCLLEKDYSSKVFFFQPTSYGLFCQPALLICYVSLSGWKCFSSVKNYQNRQCFSHQKCVKWLLIPNHWLLSIGQQRRHGDGGRKRVRQPRCWLKGQRRRRRHMLADMVAYGMLVGTVMTETPVRPRYADSRKTRFDFFLN